MFLSLSDAERFLELEKRLYEFLPNLEVKLEIIMAHLDNLIEKVTRIETQSDSIIALVHGLAEELRQNAEDAAEINAIADRLDAKANDIQTAVEANTPTPPEE